MQAMGRDRGALPVISRSPAARSNTTSIRSPRGLRCTFIWGATCSGRSSASNGSAPRRPERACARRLHRVGRFVSRERARQVGLDLLLRLPAILLGELHADAGGALALIALGALGRHPDDAPGDGQLLVLAHEIEQHEHFIAEAVIAVGGDEKTAVLHERHVREIQGTLVLDREGQQTRLVSTRSQILVPIQLCRPCIHPWPPLRSPPAGAIRLKRASSAIPLLRGTSSVARRSRTSSISPNSSRIFKNAPASDK